MARRSARPQPDQTLELPALTRTCPACGGPLWAAYKTQRVGHHPRRHRPAPAPGPPLSRPRLPPPRASRSAPSRRGASPCPEHEFGLDVIALVGTLRHAQHRSVPEIHAELARRGVPICLRTVANLLDRYDELLALSLADTGRLRRVTAAAGRVILAIDGLQPDVGHEVLWVLRDCLSRRGPPGQEPPVLDPGRPGPAASPRSRRRWRCRSSVWSPTARTRSARRSRRPSTACPINSATSTTCARRPSRSTRPTATPRRS